MPKEQLVTLYIQGDIETPDTLKPLVKAYNRLAQYADNMAFVDQPMNAIFDTLVALA